MNFKLYEVKKYKGCRRIGGESGGEINGKTMKLNIKINYAILLLAKIL